jgi:hypothetical protein
MKFTNLGLAAAIALSACATTESDTAQPAEITPTVTVSGSTFSTLDPIVVDYTGLPGNQTDWISLAPAGSSQYVITAWTYTQGAQTGQATFSEIPAGTYVARAYENNGNEIVAETESTFTVGTSGVSLSSAATFHKDETITIDFSGFTADAKDWITVVPANAPLTSYGEYHYTAGVAAGSMDFVALPVGNYEARAYFNDNFALVTRTAFSVVDGVSGVGVTSTKQSYLPQEAISIDWSGFTLDPTDWITIVPAGAGPMAFDEWHYTDGAAAGSMSFGGLPEGAYEARAFFADGFTLAAKMSFTVGLPPGVATEKTSYTTGDVVNVNFDHLPGAQLDWIAIAHAGSSPYDYVAWSYTNGATAGSLPFSGLAAGEYEARAYGNDSFTLLATSTFTVVAPNRAIATESTYQVGAPVVVTFSGLPGNQMDWIAITDVDAPNTSYIMWVYTNGQVDGTATFEGLPEGTYEARSYLDDSFQIVARSAPFTVAAAPVTPNP